MTAADTPVRRGLITGGSSGALARLLAAQGWQLLLLTHREERLRELTAELPASVLTHFPSSLLDRCFGVETKRGPMGRPSSS